MTVYVPGCCGTSTSTLTFCVSLGARAGSVTGRAALFKSCPVELRSSQMRPTDPAPPGVHERLPIFVIGKLIRWTSPVSTETGVLVT